MTLSQKINNGSQQHLTRHVNGILLLDKPVNKTSNAVLQEVKHLFKAKKAGHGGSLDPLATGMLPICFGQATKFAQFFLTAKKKYLVTAKLGIRTSTSDAEGEVISHKAVPPYSLVDIDRAFNLFRGEIVQVPSMYSAIKYQGKPLYYYARQGIEVPRPTRKLMIYELNVLSVKNDEVIFNLSCSKGTYVRTLVDDLGEHLGCGAHVINLRRLGVDNFDEQGMITLENLQAVMEKGLNALDAFLLPINEALMLPIVNISENIAFYLQQGQSVYLSEHKQAGLVKLMINNTRFIGVGEVLENGRLVSKRLLAKCSK